MTKYNISNLRRHWETNAEAFVRDQAASSGLLHEVVQLGSLVVSLLAQRKALEPNCSFLLLAKALNHAYSTLILLERGLVIDAQLTCRNAIETLLLIELLVKRPDLMTKWIAGHEFTPAEVRKQLADLPVAPVNDVVIHVSSDDYEDARFVYGTFSRLTHANLESLNHAVSAESVNSFVVHIGGAHSPSWSIAIAGALGSTFLRACLTAVAAYAPAELEQHREAFGRLQEKLGDVLRSKKGT